jgi:2-haloacid dehalogenase
VKKRSFANVGACAFDAYGTLFDFNTVERCRDRLGDKTDALRNLWRSTQLQYFWIHTLIGRHRNFEAVTTDALGFSMALLGIDDEPLKKRLMNLYREVQPYPDVLDMLRQLRAKGLKTAIHSNGTPDLLDAAVKSCGVQDLFDDVISIEDIGLYKPHPRAYQLAVDRLGLPAERICFISSNGWDVHGAAVFGFRVAWVNRDKRPLDILPGEIDYEIRSLAELPKLF